MSPSDGVGVATNLARSREGQKVEQHDVILLVRKGDVLSLDAGRRETSDNAKETISYPADWRERRVDRRESA